MREFSRQPSVTPRGHRRVARWRSASGAWFLDIDCKWPVPDRDKKRFAVFYGPSVVFSFAARKEAFAYVRSIIKTDRMGWQPCPYRGAA